MRFLPHDQNASRSTVVKIGPGEHYVTRQKDEVIVTVLGSCVAACMRDPVAGIGGMNHFMLPESSNGVWGGVTANMRYGNFAMERLINDIHRAGGHRSRLEVKIFGGASMLANGPAIGDANADFVEAYLKAERMPVVARDLRGTHARHIRYEPSTGKVLMLELAHEDGAIKKAERGYLDVVRRESDGGSIELFD